MFLRNTQNDEKSLCRSGFHTRHAFDGIRIPTYEQRTQGLFVTVQRSFSMSFFLCDLSVLSGE